MAQLALNLYDIGVLSEKDEGSPSELVEKGVNRWIGSIVADTPQLNPVGGRLAADLDGTLGAYGVCDPDSSTLWLTLFCQSNDAVICVGDVMMELESVLPGLGETVFDAIEMASYKTSPAFTPGRALYEATRIYWQGTDTDKDWEEEMEACYEDEWEQMKQDGELYWPTQYRGSFKQAWVLHAQPRVPERKLKKLARRHQLPWVRRLCVIALHAKALIARNAMLPDVQMIEAQSVYPSVYIRWDEEDDLMRVSDDFIEMANQGCDGFTDAISITDVPLEKDEFLRWEERTRMGLRLYHLLDAALAVVAERNQEIENDRNRSSCRGSETGPDSRDNAVLEGVGLAA